MIPLNDFMNRVKNHEFAAMVYDNPERLDGIKESIWRGLLDIHGSLNLLQEQAIIMIPESRRIFKLDGNDSNVILDTIKKFLDDELLDPGENAKKLVKEMGLNNPNLFVNGVPNTTTGGIEGRRKVMSVLDVHDSQYRYYALNSEGAFLRDDLTLYLPNVKDGDVVYVTYKPKPLSIDYGIDLPDELEDLLLLFVYKDQIKNLDTTPPNVIGYYETLYANRMQTKRILGIGQIPNTANAERLVKRKGFA